MDPLILLVDDERDFREPRGHMVARTSREALDALHIVRETGQILDELWLDHDLGGDDTTLVVLDMLAEASAIGDPYPVRQVYVHSMNNVGAATLMRSLRTYMYPVQRISASEYLIVSDSDVR